MTNFVGRGSTRNSGRGRSRTFGRRSGRSTRRKLVWDMNVFAPTALVNPSVTEAILLTSTEIEDLYGQRPTVAQIYGEIGLDVTGAAGTVATGAWGIRAIDSDSAASTTVYSPFTDAGTTEWITLRAFSLVATADQANRLDNFFFRFQIKNPRSLKPDQDLAMVIELATGTSPVTMTFWSRVGILLP